MTVSTVPKAAMRVGEYRKLLSHGAIYAVGALLARIVSFVMMPLYTRALSPAEYGVVDLLDTTASVIVNLTNVAITYSVMRFYYDVEADRDRSKVISTAMLGLAVLGIFAVSLFWPAAPSLSSAMFDSGAYAPALRLMAVTAVFYGLIEVPMTYMRALERPGLFMIVSLARLALGVLCNVVLVVWMRMGVMGVVWANVATSAISVLALGAFTFSRTGFGFDSPVLRGMMRFGLPFIPSSLAMLVIHNGDRYILNAYRPLSEIGIYSLGYKLGMILTYAISVPFANVWSTRMYTVVREPGGMETYSRVSTYFVFALLLGWLGLSTAAPELVTLAASPEYAAAAWFVPVISGGYLLREVSECWKNAFLIQNRTQLLAWIQPVTAVVNLGLTWLLVRPFGTHGAAWATALTFVLLLGLTATLAERVMRTPTRVRPLMVAAGSAMVIFGISRVLPAMPIWLGLPVKVLLALTFIPALLLFRAVPVEDRDVLIGALARLRSGRVRRGPEESATRSSLHS